MEKQFDVQNRVTTVRRVSSGGERVTEAIGNTGTFHLNSGPNAEGDLPDIRSCF